MGPTNVHDMMLCQDMMLCLDMTPGPNAVSGYPPVPLLLPLLLPPAHEPAAGQMHGQNGATGRGSRVAARLS
jgi:hypothetical protein